MSFNTLPNELIERIVINLNYIDLVDLSQVNSRFNSYLTNYSCLWRKLFRKQWPTLYAEVFEPMNSQTEINWRSETIQCHLIAVKVFNELRQMSARYHQKDELSDQCFDCIRKITTEDRHGCLLDELENIVNSDNEGKYDLTIKFYAQKVLRSVRADFVRGKWIKMVEESNYTRLGEAAAPVDVQHPSAHDLPGDLITGSVLIAQFCQPNKTVSEKEIRRKIRAIALEVVRILQETFPTNYLITQRNGKLLTQFEASHLIKSISEPKDSMEVIHAMNVVMYEGSSRFCGNRENYYLPTNSYIDKVLELKSGIPITLCVLYQAIAALLGVKLFPVGHPGHFLLAICYKPHISEVNEQFTYIDPFNGGEVLSLSNLYGRMTPSRPLSVFMRMSSNLIELGRREIRNGKGLNMMRTGAELAHLIYEEDVETQSVLAKTYLALDINQEQVIQIYNRVSPILGMALSLTMDTPPPLPTAVKHRTNVPALEFAVGMVMRDHSFNLNCVIYGWDEKCEDEESSKWLEQYHTDDENQAFYRVLSDDGLTRYAPQEHLYIEWRTNSRLEEMFLSQLGRYFTRFNGRNYELNEEMRTLYPHDERTLDEIYGKHST